MIMPSNISEEEGKIRFVAQFKDRYLYLRVEDNGPGIADEDKSGYLIDSTEWIRRGRVKRVVLV